MNRLDPILIILLFLLLTDGCAPTRLNRTVYDPKKQDQSELPTVEDHIIKIHQKDGGLYILKEWTYDSANKVVTGYGLRYSPNRKLLEKRSGTSDQYRISYADISLIETNKIEHDSGNLLAISIIGVPFAIVSIICLTDPKACFGSCPTFYARKNGDWKMMAEGFSSSISSAFEKTDVDMLYGIDQNADEVNIKLTNEALETHVIRYVDLLAFPEEPGEMVFATEEGEFYRTTGTQVPSSCMADEGDITPLIQAVDQQERYSLADENNLAEREEIIMRFAAPKQGESGLLISSRQSLLTTFLFYQLIAFSGKHYGDMVSKVENQNKPLSRRIARMWDKLGGIEVFIQTNGRWEKVDEINEMGPIASDTHLVKLPAVQQDSIVVKLRQTKGLWRLDYLALTQLVGPETPIRIEPAQVTSNDSICTDVLRTLHNSHEPLITLPGDQYEISYQLPGDCNYQLFLETKGYYLEWMRENWLQEEAPLKAALALQFPGLFFRKAAPAFKLAEPQMEELFWNSRYVKQ